MLTYGVFEQHDQVRITETTLNKELRILYFKCIDFILQNEQQSLTCTLNKHRYPLIIILWSYILFV